MRATVRTIKRKSGEVAVLHVEILVSQMQRLNDDCEKYKMNKGEIVEQALQLWHNTVDKAGG